MIDDDMLDMLKNCKSKNSFLYKRMWYHKRKDQKKEQKECYEIAKIEWAELNEMYDIKP